MYMVVHFLGRYAQDSNLVYLMIWEKNLIEAFVIFVKDVCSGYAIQNSITKVVELSESD